MNRKQAVDKVLNDFIERFTYRGEFLSAEYVEGSDSYYVSNSLNSKIVLGGLTNKKADEIFMKYCKETLGLKTEVSIETLTFLHEFGHHKSIDYLTDDEIYESEAVKMMLYMKDEESEETFMQYFTCPDEELATTEAVEFCNVHSKVAKQLDKDLLKALYE